MTPAHDRSQGILPVARALLCFGIVALVSTRVAAQAVTAAEADRLFSRRDPASVALAITLWQQQLDAHPADAEAAWKLARACYWTGANVDGERAVRRTVLERGMAAARRAIAIAPTRPEGHFWLAANMGMLAELFGRREGLRYRADIRQGLERTIASDPAFLHGAAQRMLGRWYASVPTMFGGDKKKGEAHLRTAVADKPDSAIALVLLAELLIATGRPVEARPLLVAAAAAPDDPDWAPEDQRFRERARVLLSGRRPTGQPESRGVCGVPDEDSGG